MKNGTQLYKKVQAMLVLQDKTFNEVCRSTGVPNSTVKSYLTGSSTGEKSRRATLKVLVAAGLEKLMPTDEERAHEQVNS